MWLLGHWYAFGWLPGCCLYQTTLKCSGLSPGHCYVVANMLVGHCYAIACSLWSPLCCFVDSKEFNMVSKWMEGCSGWVLEHFSRLSRLGFLPGCCYAVS